MLPTGASQIFEARLRGKRPADLVIVSMVGHLREANPVVLADGDDWRWVEGLQVCIFAKRGCKHRELALQIAYYGPAWLALWDVENEEGAEIWPHLRADRLNQNRFTADDFTANYWPWVEWQNKQFRGEHAAA